VGGREMGKEIGGEGEDEVCVGKRLGVAGEEGLRGGA